MTIAELEALDKPGQTACVIVSQLEERLVWLPTTEEAAAYNDTIDIDDWMTAGLPNTNYRQAGEVGGLVAGVDY